jgi:hypothetical protein
MTAATSHRLDGLEPDNLLAFLALLGLLRALEMKRPDWKPRAYWDIEYAPLRPVLTTQEATTIEDISKAALDGLLIFRTALWPFSWPRTKQGSVKKTALFFDQSRQRALSRRCTLALGACGPNDRRQMIWKLRCDLLAISGGSRSDRKKGQVLDVTPLKLPSGQMAFIGAQFDAISACQAEHVHSSLFKTWTYSHKGNSLRFSPDEAQRYAYRASDPSPEGSRTELGASALSGLGLLTFTMSEARPHWRVVAYTGRRSEGKICWPIWDAGDGAGASLQMIAAILRALTPDAQPSASIRSLVRMIATARRYVLDPNQGDYGNITRAELSFTADSP